ncbi:hypothetical protein EG329_013773 [Mollisiaceae sp. DMI_Dod_QoI]|nr:hypothetical protein EG329_013773 [Helotiales sp. DMI_Dod_QoI]
MSDININSSNQASTEEVKLNAESLAEATANLNISPSTATEDTKATPTTDEHAEPTAATTMRLTEDNIGHIAESNSRLGSPNEPEVVQSDRVEDSDLTGVEQIGLWSVEALENLITKVPTSQLSELHILELILLHMPFLDKDDEQKKQFCWHTNTC